MKNFKRVNTKSSHLKKERKIYFFLYIVYIAI